MFPRHHARPELSWHEVFAGTKSGRRGPLHGTRGGATPLVVWSCCEGEGGSRGEKCGLRARSSWRQRFGAGSSDDVRAQILAELRRATALCQLGCSARAKLPWSSRPGCSRGLFNCTSSRLGQKGEWRRAVLPAPTSMGAKVNRQTSAAPMDAPPGLELALGRTASAPEKPRGRSLTAAFGLQGAHAESADEFDALLDDAQNAGLSGVDRLDGASLNAKVIKTRECRPDVLLERHFRRVKQQLRVLAGEARSFSRYNDQMVQGHCGNFKTLRRMLAAVAGTMDEHRTASAERAVAMTSRLYLKLRPWIPSTNSNGHGPCCRSQTQRGVTTCTSLRSSSRASSVSTRKPRETPTPTHERSQLGHASDRPPRRHQGCKLRSKLAFKAS